MPNSEREPNARVLENAECIECAWPVILVYRTEALFEKRPYMYYDYWMYCSNPTCVHHQGEGVSSGNGDMAQFVVRIEKVSFNKHERMRT